MISKSISCLHESMSLHHWLWCWYCNACPGL